MSYPGLESVAPLAIFEYDINNGRVLYTLPRGGFTLVDQFAASALPALLEAGSMSPKRTAVDAYDIAEAMVAERERRYARIKG